MKMLKKTIPAVALALALALSIGGCSFENHKEGTQVVIYLEDGSIMERYMNAVEEYDRVEYEEVYIDRGERSIGPTEYRFRGIVYLTEEEAERLWDTYEWEEADPAFEFEQVDIGSAGDGPWYSCEQFNKDNYSTIVPSYTVFDGKNLVFDIHQI